ncbi:MAG TPA: MogA/MoaB family molybdenum cofactor biosynthesis protein [Terriglobia bacterium]|nr:MogA/MoaB family molybdenum cofactor biosynthesis protein [Terriglobia bacterium]
MDKRSPKEDGSTKVKSELKKPAPRVKILVTSDSSARGERPDAAGPALRAVFEARHWHVAACQVLPDDLATVRTQLIVWADVNDCDVIVTCGGTGLSPRDITPEATRAVIEKEVPGLAELIRAEGVKKTRRAALSRGLAGICKGKLIVNLPGSPRGACESLESVIDILPHAIDICQGRTEHKQNG